MPCRCVPAVDITLYRVSSSAEGEYAKEYFSRKGVAIEDIDISVDPQAQKIVENLSHQRERPVIVVNQRVFIGFDPDQMNLVVPSLF